MPFIKQTVLQARRPPAEVGNIFTGRNNEQHFFVEHVLTPEIPAYHMISVWGPAGVGKSTLLARLRDEARSPAFKDACLTALVDGRQGFPTDIMERCAAQLRLAGAPLAAFEQVLTRYRQTAQHRQPEQAVARAAFLREVAAQAGSKVMSEPLLGGLYAAVASEASASFWPAGEAGRLDDPLGDLTRAFVDDLNWLTTTQAPFHPHGTARGRRVILFFDTFEPSAAETISWLLHAVLPATISDQVVLVVAGREPIQYALPNEQPVYTMPLAPFTEDETRTYLAERGMTAADRVAAIWHLSGGLPLYVSMLAYDQAGHVDETTDVVANIVRWMVEQDHSTQRLVLQAALFSRPFTQDDLAAFHALSEQERTDLYRWLIGLPFVQPRSLDGRHRCHDLAQQLLSRAFAQHAPQEEQATHRALANHYQRLLERIQAGGGKGVYSSAEWLELALARVSQLFCLPDAASHASAIEQVMTICHEAQQQRTIAQVLRPLAQKQPPGHENAGARRIAQLLLHYLEANLASRKLLTAANGLLEAVRHAPAFSALVLARLYGKRGMAYCSRNKYQRASADFDQALALDPAYAGAYLLRGIAHSACKEYQRAIADFDQALALDARATFAYVHRGIAY